jgi:hypothetical protein
MFEVSRKHKIRHTNTSPVGLLWRSDRPVTEAANYTTQQIQETNIPTLSAILTLEAINGAATDLRLREA